MFKKILLIICLFFLTGCALSINDMSYEEIIKQIRDYLGYYEED